MQFMRIFGYLRKWRRLLPLVFGVGVLSSMLWITGEFVGAYIEVKRAYIYPSAVTTVGWQQPEAALSQQTSEHASLGNFSTQNSAHVLLSSTASALSGGSVGGTIPPTDTDPELEEDAANATSSEQTVNEEVQEEDAEDSAQSSTNATDSGDVESEEEIATEADGSADEEVEAPAETSPEEADPMPGEGDSIESAEVHQSEEEQAPESIPASDPAPETPPATEAPEEVADPESPQDGAEASLFGRALRLAMERVSDKALHALSKMATVVLATTTSATSSEAATPNSEDIPVVEPEDIDTASVQNDDSETEGTASTTDVASCTVQGEECYTIMLSGFGIEGALLEKKMQGATLKFSFANLPGGEEGSDDRLLVRYFRDGRWRSAGEIFLNKEISNAENGGYFSHTIEEIESWEDLQDLIVVFEYDRNNTDTSVELYLDAVWIEALYQERAQDVLSGDADDTPEVPGNVAFDLPSNAEDEEVILALQDGTHIAFPYASSLDENLLEVRTNGPVVSDESGIAYVSITNDGTSEAAVALSVAFPGGAGQLLRAEQFKRNVPVPIETPIIEDVAYWCSAGWIAATSTLSQATSTAEQITATSTDTGGGAQYACAETGEEHTCAWLNDERTNCQVEGVAVDVEQSTAYQSAWVSVEFGGVSNAEDAADFPSPYVATAKSDTPVMILPGQTVFFKLTFDVPASGVVRYALSADGGRYHGRINTSDLETVSALRAALLAEDTEAEEDDEVSEFNDQLSSKLNFDGDELPEFRFKFKTQRGLFTRLADVLFSREVPFVVNGATLRHASGQEERLPVEIQSDENGEWTLRLTKHPRAFRPGKYSIELSLQEGAEVYEDTVEFYWGVLAINTDKSLYATGEEAYLQMAALEDDGNTICDARLLLSIVSPSGIETEVPVEQSGSCGPNNVTEVPDYIAYYTIPESGEYAIQLSMKNDEGGVVHTITDSFSASGAPLFDVARQGPTRIYPLAPYTMTLTITAQEAFTGTIVETLPEGFSIVDQGGGSRARIEDAQTLSWNAVLAAGETTTIQYEFDAPDVSPYLFLLGPLELQSQGVPVFKETRTWKIASDAVAVGARIAWLYGNQTTNGTNLNDATAYALEWNINGEFDSTYFATSTLNPEELTVNTDGDYLIALTLPMERNDANNNSRTRIEAEVRVDGAKQNIGVGRSSYIRNTGGHEESSDHLHVLLENLTAGQDITVYVRAIMNADVGDVVNITDQASLYAEYIRPAETIFNAVATTTTAGTNFNPAAATEVVWFNSTVDSGYTHDNGATPEDITLDAVGNYLVFINIPLDGSVARSNVRGRVLLDGGVVDGGQFKQGYIRDTENDTTSSIHWSGVVRTTATDQVLSIDVQQEAAAGTLTVGSERASLYIQQLPSSDVYIGRGTELTAGTTDWNPASAQSVEWETDDVIDTGVFTHSTITNPHQVTVDVDGDYLLVYNDSLTSNSTRINNRISVLVNGSPLAGAETKSHYLRQTGHAESSGSLVYLLRDLAANDVITVSTVQEGANGTFDDDDDALLLLWRKAQQNAFIQNTYRWYANTNAEPPSDPWPPGATDLGEDEEITTGNSSESDDVHRLRISLQANVNTTLGADAFALQYAEGSTCSVALTWIDVGDIGSGEIWRGYDNAGVSDGATLSTTVLTASDVEMTYQEENPSAATVAALTTGEDGEWDWVIENNGAPNGTDYCFRMADSSGQPLKDYVIYPQLVTNAAPDVPTLSKLFDNERTASTSPWFEFVSSDDNSEDIHYMIEIDDDPVFGSPAAVADSQTNFNAFENVEVPSDKSPFTSGQVIRFISTTTLSNGTTYWWRVRARDPNGTNDWSVYSTARSFTINTSLQTSEWFQTMEEQFDTNTLEQVETPGSDDLRLVSGPTVGTTTTGVIDFDWGEIGNAWGSFSWTDDETDGTITYHIEYDNNGAWELIPDSHLGGNATGFGSSPVVLTSLDTTIYNRIRLIAVFNETTDTPILQDWTLSWALAVSQPTVTSLFDNEKTGTTTPTFEFVSDDPQGDDLVYQISWSSDTAFTSSTTRSSDQHAGFLNIDDGGDTSPFTQNDTIQFTVQPSDAVIDGETYWWRVRAKDPSGGDAWSLWSLPRSFTASTTVTVSTWFQTTTEQFETDTLTRTEATNNQVEVSTAVGQVAIYREATASDAITTSIFTHDFDTTVRADSLYSLSGNSDIQLQDGYYAVMYGARFDSTGGTNRSEMQSYLTLDGNALPIGWSQGYIRRSQGSDEAFTSGGGIIFVENDNDVLTLNTYRTDVNSATVQRAANTAGIQLVRLDSTWDFLRLGRSTALAGPTSSSWEDMVYNRQDEVDAGSFQHVNGTGNILLKDVGHYLVFANTYGAITTNDRTLIRQKLTLDGSDVEGSFTTVYIRGDQNSEQAFEGATSLGMIIETTAVNQVLNVELSRGDGTTAWIINEDDTGAYVDRSAITIVKLPDAEFIRLSDSGADDINPASLTALGWDTELEEDAASFTHPVSTDAQIQLEVDGDYLFLTSNYAEAAGVARAVFSQGWQFVAGALIQYGQTGGYNRNSTADDVGNWSGIVFENVTAGQDVEAVVQAIGNSGSMANDRKSVQGTRIGSWVESDTRPITIDSSDIVFTDGLGPKWSEFTWNDTEPGATSIVYQVLYATSSTYELVPDVDLVGNSTGYSSGTVGLGGLDVNTYGTLRLRATFNCAGGECPTLQDWQVTWSEGIDVSGTLKEYDQLTDVTSGTIAVAVNGVLQVGKTGTVTSGSPVVTSYETAGVHTFTVPAGVTSVTVKAWGAGGGGGASENDTGGGANIGGDGGGAGFQTGILAVTPGEELDIIVGGGGVGGTGWAGGGEGGGGGGHSEISDDSGLVVVAGGGGGGGGSSHDLDDHGGDGAGGGGSSANAGADGGSNGAPTSGGGGGGGGGDQTNGGAGGSTANAFQGGDGTAGGVESGGSGGNASGSCTTGSAGGGAGGSNGGGAGGSGSDGDADPGANCGDGGGGGSGYRGGGGGEGGADGGGGGGGGGSSYADGVITSPSTVAGGGPGTNNLAETHNPGGTGDGDYNGTAGVGGLGGDNGDGVAGTPGLVVVSYSSGAGTWNIPNVTAFSGDVITVWVEGAANAEEAVAVTVYDGSGDITGIELFERHVSIGSDDLATVTNANLGMWDVDDDEDAFHDVDGSNDLDACALPGCEDVEMWIKAGNSYRPDSASSGNVDTHDIEINGTLIADGNTLRVSGSWDNNATSTANTSTVIFTATSGTETVDTTGSTAWSFNNITFGEGSGTAEWDLATSTDINGALTINFGTLDQNGANAISIAGNLSIGASGLFTKGTASTTFDGTGSRTWSDNSSPKQDFGAVVIDGTAKIVSFTTGVRATDIVIGADDTLAAASGNTIEVLGNWTNTGVFSAGTGTVNFTAGDTGNTITPGASNFNHLTFNNASGGWSFTSGTVTANGNVTITDGVVTLASGTTTVAGNFDASSVGGTFMHNNGVLNLTASAARTVHPGVSSMYDLTFNGSGSWTFPGGQATTSRHTTIAAGTVTLPAGVLAVSGSFLKNGGTFAHNSGTLKMTASDGQTIRLNNNDAYNLTFDGSGSWTFTGANATSTNTVSFVQGTATLPSGVLAVGGSWSVNGGAFSHNNGTVRFMSSDAGETINSGSSLFGTLVFDNTTGGWTISAHATSTASTTLQSAASFTLASGQSLEVGGTFSNFEGGGDTVWTGSTLYLNGIATTSINTKAVGGDTYGTLLVGANNHIRMWNSSSTAFIVEQGGSLYSQDHDGVDGDLYIWGSYVPSGNEYWSYATDFDGTDLSGGSERQVNVRMANNAAITHAAGTLQMVGDPTASTTIANQTSGSYSVDVTGGTVNARYYQIQDTDATGLAFSGTPSITSLADGDFTLTTEGGSMVTLEDTVIDANAALQIQRVQFATSTGIGSGANVTANGSPSSYWWFRNHYGNYDGEAFDADPGGNPGNVRWDDSNISVTVSGNVYADHGVNEIGNPPCDDSTPVVTVLVNGASPLSAACAEADGAYSIPGVSFIGDVVLTTYLDTDGGARAVAVTKTPSVDITDMDLYENALIVRHESTEPMTNSDLSAYDSGDDTDIPFAVSGGALTTEPDTELFVWDSMEFAPGGNVILGSGGSGDSRDGRLYLDANATFTAAGTQSHSIGGGFIAESGATVTPANSTVRFTATTTGKVIDTEDPLSLYNLVFQGVGGGWSLDSASGIASTSVQNSAVVTSGTLAGTGDLIVEEGIMIGDGTVAFTGGTVRLETTGGLGGNSDWQFYNLVLGDGTTLATTTKSGTGTTTIAGVLTIQNNHEIELGSAAFAFSGGGTPLVANGIFDVESAPVFFTSTAAVSVADETYTLLTLAPSGAGSPTYTLLGGTFSVGDLVIGDGTNAVTVTADTNDPSMAISGDMTISANGAFTASNVGALEIGGSYDNDGTFTHSNGSILFNSADTGETIAAGASVFGDTEFDAAGGGWTVTEHATSSGDTLLTSATSFTVSADVSLEVGGTFTNSIGGATTWTGSTLYLNSGSAFAVSSKTAPADQYATLLVGPNTDVRMWNSSSGIYGVDATGSLYSQDHSGADGELYLWGAYERASGSDYWSYASDFDGTDLSGGLERKVDVYFADGASATLSSGVLDIIGSAAASTTIQNQGSGNYSMLVSGGTFNARYYELRDFDDDGLQMSGSPTISSLSDGDFEDGTSGGTMLTVAGSVITANPLKTFFRNRFATSTGITGGSNVTATGSTGSSWKFNLHYGNYAGEAFDTDPAGDPGYLIWDDSAANISISGVVLSDEASAVSGVCDDSTPVVRLMVEGVGNRIEPCASADGAYSISNVSFNPGDVLTLYLDTDGGPFAANVSVDPITTISDMDLYEERVIVRHEDASPITIANMAIFDSSDDADIPFTATDDVTDTLVTPANTKVIVWGGKTFAPAGNLTLESGGSGDAWDGTMELYAGASFTAAGTQAHSIGGSLVLGAGASLSPANSTFTMTATTTGKTITLQTSSLYDLTFNGTGGNWAFGGSAASTTNDLTIADGTVTLPSGTLTVGGSFENTGGTFMHNNGTTTFTRTSGGGTVRAGGSNFYNLSFNGSGGAWAIQDTNATSSNNVTIEAGGVTLPSGVLAVGGSFDNAGGTFTHNSGTVRLYATAAGKTVRTGGSDLRTLVFDGSGGAWAIADTNATTTDSVSIVAGSVSLPLGTLAVGGSFDNAGGTFTHNAGTVRLNAGATGNTVASGGSPFGALVFDNAAGGWTVTEHATTTASFSLLNATSFTLASGQSLEVGGTFTNLVGGAATTWTGGTLYLNSATAFSAGGKSVAAETYETLLIGASTDVRMWNSTASVITVVSSGSLYSQDHAAIDGDLYIYGEYVRTSGSDYWSYATDFDGTALGGSSRQANVRFAAGASATSSGGTLEILGGDANSSTTIRAQGSGAYSFAVSGGILNANYYQFRDLNENGVYLSGSPTVTSLSNGDIEIGVANGRAVTVVDTVVDANASKQISNVRFATSTGILGGYNVVLSGTPIGSWNFLLSSGNFDGEAFDLDGGDACGNIRWSDSACLFVSQEHYRWRNDDDGEGAPASEWFDGDWGKRQRITVANPNASLLTDLPVKVEILYDSDMQSDFDDLRFTDADGVTEIDYWIEAFTASSIATVWIELPTVPASDLAVAYMYYDNATALTTGDGDATFSFFDDFEDDDIDEYSGDTSLFNVGTSFNHNGTFGLDASGNETQQTTNGIYRTGSLIGQGDTIRYFQYVDSGEEDEVCTFFGVAGAGQNYAVCLDQYPDEQVTLSEDVTSNDDSGSELDASAVTFATGWYEVEIDWLSDNSISVTIYDDTQSVFATLSATDATYTSGGMGFSFWGQHGGWDNFHARPYAASDPTYATSTEQTNAGATWAAAEDTPLSGADVGENLRLRLAVHNSGAEITSQEFRLQYAAKGAAASCEAVPLVNYNDVPTTSGGCGSSPACMTSSTQFTNQSPTTQHLSAPVTLAFSPGEILEDPSNESTSMTVAEDHFTELEYNFQLTANASQNAYCFRTSNGGLDLDNYSKVAEVMISHPPSITNWTLNQGEDILLTEGSTTTITATGTATDLNGFGDLVVATSTIYRSAVGALCTDDDNNCYQIAMPACAFTNCAGNSCTLSCSADIVYLAEPTDPGAIYEAQEWLSGAAVEDATGQRDTVVSLGVELMTLFGLSVDTDIDFGALEPGADTDTVNAQTSVENTGNTNIDIQLLGSDLFGDTDSIPVGQQKYATTTFAYGACAICGFLSGSATDVEIDLPKPTASTTAITNNVYWGIAVPQGKPAESYEGTNTFFATSE